MTRQQFKTLQRAWLRFDRATAYGCRMRGELFDLARMQAAWDEYIALVDAPGESG